MLTLMTTLDADAPLLIAIQETGLVSRIVRNREEQAALHGATVLLVNWPYILDEGFIARQSVVVNVHNSLLPRYRGRHAFTWAVMEGEQELGFSLHKVVAAVDAGDVLAQASFRLQPDEDINDAFRYGEELLVAWLPRTLKEWTEGRLQARPQDELKATMYRRRRPEDNWLGSFGDAEQVRNFVRAVAPPYTPGAMCCTQAGEILHIASARLATDVRVADAAPGSVLDVTGDAVSVACSSGAVWLVPVESSMLDSFHAGDLLLATAEGLGG